MRNPALHAALRDFALEAAAHLSRAVGEGEELRFALDEEPGARGGLLYHYRPLTDEYIEARWDELRALPAAGRAIAALGSGARAYLRLHGLGGADAEPALRALLERLYEDAIGFGFPEERFERLYAEVERSLYDGTARATVVAPLAGVALDAPRVELGEGLSVLPEDAALVPDEAVRAHRRGELGDPGLPVAWACLERDLPAAEELPLHEARVRFSGLVTGLRLFRAGAVALSSLGWARLDEGAWRPCALGAGDGVRGDVYVLDRMEVAALREFLPTLARASATGAVGWALDRFEMGCARALDTEAVTDHLLALRALLDGGDEQGAATLSLRLAALCAEEGDRRAVQRGLELALALERFAIAGTAGAAYTEQVGPAAPRAIAAELEAHLRSLLRGVLSGQLEPNLRAVADRVLLERGEPIEIQAHDTRRFRREPERQPPGRADEAETGEIDALREDALAEPAPRAPRSQLAHAPPAGAPPRRPARETEAPDAPAGATAVAEPEPEPEPGPPEPDAAAPEAPPLLRYDEPDAPRLWRAAAAPPEPAELWAAGEDEQVAAGVTPSADWDEDAESYSAPV